MLLYLHIDLNVNICWTSNVCLVSECSVCVVFQDLPLRSVSRIWRGLTSTRTPWSCLTSWPLTPPPGPSCSTRRSSQPKAPPTASHRKTSTKVGSLLPVGSCVHNLRICRVFPGSNWGRGGTILTMRHDVHVLSRGGRYWFFDPDIDIDNFLLLKVDTDINNR